MNHLGDTEPCLLNEGQLSYTAMLDEITLEPGVYRLQAIVKLEGIFATPGSFNVPLIQVIYCRFAPVARQGSSEKFILVRSCALAQPEDLSVNP